jgi:hypothetical protein
MTIETLREFFGWCTIINFGLLVFTFVKLMLIRDLASKVHAKMFGIDQASVQIAYFQFFAIYKIAFIVFNFVPYIALSLMASA